MDIYIKLSKKYSLCGKKIVCIGDIAEVQAKPSICGKIKKIIILKIKSDENKSYLVTIIDVIKAIDNVLPNCTVNSVGETDTVIEYSSKIKNENKLLTALKIIFVVIVLAAGSATAIMSYHSDSQMETIFENYYYIFFGERIANPTVINLPYSIGLAFGIIVFFNHFSGKKLTSDPTPIEVEMSLYEGQVTDNIIDTLNCERAENADN